jgi:HSP20 family protein
VPGLSTVWGRDVDPFRASIRRMFEDPFSIANDLLASAQPVGWMPAVEITENEKSLIVTAELPGTKLEDVHVSLENDVLMIRGEKTEERDEKDAEKKFHVFERHYGAFQRAFTLPCPVIPDKVQARFDKGVLTVTLEKAKEPAVNGREIKITAS